MRRTLLSLFLFLGTSFFLSGLQSNFYFLPFPVPHFWFIVLTYYSFKKDLLFSLVANILHSLIICSFSSISISFFLIIINLFSLSFHLIGKRFHTNNQHLVLAAGSGCFLFYFFKWCLLCLRYDFFYPSFLPWIGASLMTLIVALPFLFVFDRIDKKIHSERISLLKHLRI